MGKHEKILKHGEHMQKAWDKHEELWRNKGGNEKNCPRTALNGHVGQIIEQKVVRNSLQFVVGWPRPRGLPRYRQKEQRLRKH